LFRRWLDRRAAHYSNNTHPRGDSVGDGDFNGQKVKKNFKKISTPYENFFRNF